MQSPKPSGVLTFDVLALAFETSRDGIAMLDLDGVLLAPIAGGASAFDLPADPAGRNWIEVWRGAERDAARLAVEAARRGERATTVGTRATATGALESWESTLTPVPGPDGTPERILVVSREVAGDPRLRCAPDAQADRPEIGLHDGRTGADVTLRASEERLRLAVEATGLGTWDVDIRTGHRDWSPALKAMLGLPAEAPCTEAVLLERVHPGDREMVAHHNRTTFVESRQPEATFRIVRADTGETRWIISQGRVVLDSAGAPVRRIGSFRDITDQQLVRQELRQVLRRYEALLSGTSEIVWHSDEQQGFHTAPHWEAFTGQRADAMQNLGWLEVVHPDDRARTLDTVRRACESGLAYTSEFRLHHRSGEWRWVIERALPLHDDDGRMCEWVGVIADMNDKKVAEDRVRKSEEHLRLAIEATGMGTWDADAVSGAREWSPELFDLMGLPQAPGTSDEAFLVNVHPDDRERIERELYADPTPEACSSTSVFRVHHGGEERWLEARKRTFFAQGHAVRHVGTLQDVTERKRADHAMWLAAHTDDLTGVANRALFQTRLDEALAATESQGTAGPGSHVALLVVDLDHFKEINDTLGHDAGDAVLRMVTRRLEQALPPTATLARLGGDEFGILLPGLDPGDAGSRTEAVAAAVTATLQDPITFAGHELDGRASVGFAIHPTPGQPASALLKNADIAMYAAKTGGRNRAAAFAPDMREHMERRVNILRCTRDALARDAVRPHYQPKISLRDGGVLGFEALLRWSDGRGLRFPGEIGEAFDDPEMACRLGARMLDGIVADMRDWTSTGLSFGHVALNVAAPEFHKPGYAGQILGTLRDAGLPAGCLEIEVTEGVLLDDGTGAVAKALRMLDEAGVAIALDDFGTGYASLTHLKRFPVSWLKIDRSFVTSLGEDSDSTAIVRAVVELARNLGIRVVAEGVETRQQVRFLQRARCDSIQGYLAAKPMPASRVPRFLANWNAAAFLDTQKPRVSHVA